MTDKYKRQKTDHSGHGHSKVIEMVNKEEINLNRKNPLFYSQQETMMVEMTKEQAEQVKNSGDKPTKWVQTIKKLAKESEFHEQNRQPKSKDIKIRKYREKEQPEIIAKDIQSRIEEDDLIKKDGIQELMDYGRAKLAYKYFTDKDIPKDLDEMKKWAQEGPPAETMSKKTEDNIFQQAIDYFVYKNRFYRVQKVIEEEKKNRTSEFSLRLKVFLMDRDTYNQNSPSVNEIKVLDETLVKYSVDNSGLKIDVNSKLYLQVGPNIFFYIQNTEDKSEISLHRISLDFEISSLADQRSESIQYITLSDELKKEIKDEKKKFLGGIFGDYNIHKQQVACFGCQKEVKDFDEGKMFSMMVLYNKDQDRHYEFKLLKGKTEFNVDMKLFNQNVKIDETLGQRFVLGVNESKGEKTDLHMIKSKEQENMEDLVMIKSKEHSVQLKVNQENNQIQTLSRFQEDSDFHQKVNLFFIKIMHKIYYISDSKSKQNLKIDKKQLMLNDLYQKFMKEILALEWEVPETQINILNYLQDGTMSIQSIHGNETKTYKTIDKNSTDFRFINKWNVASKDVNLLAKSLYTNQFGFLLMTQEFSNVFMNIDKRIQIEEIENQTDQLDKLEGLYFDNLGLLTELKQDKHIQKKVKTEHRTHYNEKMGSRRINSVNDDRTVFPILVFDEECSGNESIYIEVRQIQSGTATVRAKEVIQHTIDIKEAKDTMKMCQSSAIEYLENEDKYRQNFQLCKQIKEDEGLLCYEIKEFQLTWEEKEDHKKMLSQVTFDYIGVKMLILREKVDKRLEYGFTFMPWFVENNKAMIGGTQILPFKKNVENQGQDNVPFHVILKNFEFDDFQFKGEILNSGFKIYRNEENFFEKNLLLIECEISNHYNDRVKKLEEQKKVDQDGEKIELSSQEKNKIFYDQITVIMNMVPTYKFSDQPHKVFQREHFKVFSPLEYLQGNSLCDYMLQQPEELRAKLEEENKPQLQSTGQNLLTNFKQLLAKVFQQKNKRFERKSIIKDFVNKRSCQCEQNNLPLNWEKLPNDIQIQKSSQILTDLTFNNPLKRSLQKSKERQHKEDQPKKDKPFAIESARLLLEYIFDEDEIRKDQTTTELEQRILMQAVPFVLDQENDGVKVKAFERFFRNQDTKYSFFQKCDQEKEKQYKQLPSTIADHPQVTILETKGNYENSIEENVGHLVVQQMKDQKKRTTTKAYLCCKKNDQKKEQVPVETFIIDFEPLITDTQIQILQNLNEENKKVLSFYDENDLAKILANINEFYGNDIQRQQSIKALISYYFDNMVKSYFKRIFGMYLIQCFVYVLYLTYFDFNHDGWNKILSHDDLDSEFIKGKYANQIRVLNIILLTFTWIFLWIEYDQFKSKKDEGKWKDYFEFDNNRDLGMAFTQTGLFIYRILYPLEVFESQWTSGIYNMCEALVLFLMLTKILFFLRIFKKYGIIVELIYRIVYDIRPFMLIFGMFVVSFALMYHVMGAEFSDIKDKQIYSMIAQFFTSWQMSTSEKIHFNLQNPLWFQTLACWTIWFFQQILMTIVLLNFLIALINQKYEEAIVNLEVTQTNHKAELNKEYFIDQEAKKKTVQRGRIYILQMRTKFDQKDDEWNGISKQVERHIDKKQEQIEKEFKKNKESFEDYGKKRSVLTSAMEQLKKDVNELNKQIELKVGQGNK